jgi:hypothetical protein
VSILSFSATAQNPLHLDDASVLRTFWAAAFIMLATMLLAIYYARRYANYDETAAPGPLAAEV